MIKLKKFKSVAILGFGAYLPYGRLSLGKIAQNWGLEKERVAGLGIVKKAVARADEDCLTMAVEASLIAIKRAGVSPKKIGAVFVGSESHPYAVKPTGTILADILGIKNEYFCADLQFACKAGTTGLQIVASMIETGSIDSGLVVGSDKAQAQPGDALEYTAGAGAAAFVLGKNRSNIDVDLISTYSFNSDTPDFWRRQGCKFPSHTGRFTGEPGYFYHLENCLKIFLKRIKKKPGFFDHVIFHMPNAKFPLKLAKKLRLSSRQVKAGFLVPEIGNPYSASSLLGLVSVLEQVEPNQNILVASYGSGAGSDVFWFKTRNLPVCLSGRRAGRQGTLKRKSPEEKTIKEYLANNQEVGYCTYLKNYKVL